MGRITPDLKAGAGRHLLALFPIPTDKLKLSVPFALQAVAFSLPESGPGLVLIGVSSDSNLVKMWTGRQMREVSIQDLLKVIHEPIRNRRPIQSRRLKLIK